MATPGLHHGATGGRARRQSEARILAAAETVFAVKGFEGATMAEIASQAALPKANLHYYFGTKKALYRAVIDNILELWLAALGDITPADDPAEALSAYIERKICYSRDRPFASRLFANEIIRGAPVLSAVLRRHLRGWVQGKAEVLRSWAAAGKMDPVDPAHLFFMIWAATQTYADFATQIESVLGESPLSDDVYETASRTITKVILKGCGIGR